MIDSSASSSKSKLVSILINSYNYGQFLGDAIESAIAQTYDCCEVVVVDDGSTDGSQALIASYGDRIIPVLKENGGQASAFNAGFARSRGDITCFLDADDTFAADKAQRLVNTFLAHPEAGWCFHPIGRVDSELKPMVWDESDWGKGGMYDLRSRLKRGKLGGATPFDCLVTSGMGFTRKMLSRLLPMPTDIRITSDDYLKYAAMGTSPGYMLMEKLASQRLHGNNAYTGRDEKLALQSKILLQTAYFLKRDFPVIGAFADNLYSLGLAKLDRHRRHQLAQGHLNSDPDSGDLDSGDSDIAAMMQSYKQALPPWTALKVGAKKIYYEYRPK